MPKPSVDCKGIKLRPRLPGDTRLRLLKIDLGRVNNGDTASRIPDPWLLAFKAATNWSYFAHGKCGKRILKILPVCACDEDDDKSSSSASNEFGLKMTAGEVERILANKKRREDNEITELCVGFAMTPGEDGFDDDLSVVSH